MRRSTLKVLQFLVLFLIFAFPIFSYAQISFPKYVGFVNDFENIIDNDQALNEKLTQLEKDTTVEIAVVTVDSFSGTTIEDYAVKLFEDWKIGKADKDNGLLLLVSSKERQARIEVGYGLEGTLPDSLTKRIQDQYMIPSFKDEKYSEGINNGVDALIGVIKEDPTVVSSLKTERRDYSGIIEGSIYLFFIICWLMAASKSWWLGGVLGLIFGLYLGFSQGLYYLLLVTIPGGLFLDYFLSKTLVGRAIFRGVNNGVFFGRSGGSSSGGGHSFGGGSSGGGGSSSSW